MVAPAHDRPRFTRVVASNFLSLGEDVSVELGDLTALAGVNGSGKSNVIGALTFVSQALTNGLEHAVLSRRGFQALRRAGAPPRSSVKIRYELQAALWDADYEIWLEAKGRDGYVIHREAASINHFGGDAPTKRTRYVAGHGRLTEGPEWLAKVPVSETDLYLRIIGGTPDFDPLRNALAAIRSYAIYPKALREPSKPSVLPYLDEEGGNWATIVRQVAQGQFGAFLREALHQVTGDVVDLETRQLGDNLVVRFRHATDPDQPETGPWFDAGRESDGTLRVAGLITALLQQPPLTLIAVEEPELTIHPGALPLVLDFLRLASDSSQVLFTTHSPDLVAGLDADEIRVIQRIGGTTSAAPIDPGQRELVRKRLTTPGELMRTEGLAPAPPPG